MPGVGWRVEGFVIGLAADLGGTHVGNGDLAAWARALTWARSTPISRASRRVAGVAKDASRVASRGGWSWRLGLRWPGVSLSRTSMTIMTSPTGQRSPSLKRRSSTRPACGVAISTVALSVITSTMGWSCFRDIAFLDQPADDFALGHAFANVGQLEFVGHASS
jgi:hypothetical protein